ncbi:hypothetical protein, partial [Salmonella enterica]|uniref:hypothetical protein n=1 Tax=Salmonella enterica TaxID=28901 RepID=UPI003D282507
PVTINSGPWRLRLEASNPDPNAYVNDFIYARFWFVPEDYSFNYIEPHKYRDQTEFYFNVSPSGGSTFVRDTPTDLSQLMVFPP